MNRLLMLSPRILIVSNPKRLDHGLTIRLVPTLTLENYKVQSLKSVWNYIRSCSFCKLGRPEPSSQPLSELGLANHTRQRSEGMDPTGPACSGARPPALARAHLDLRAGLRRRKAAGAKVATASFGGVTDIAASSVGGLEDIRAAQTGCVGTRTGARGGRKALRVSGWLLRRAGAGGHRKNQGQDQQVQTSHTLTSGIHCTAYRSLMGMVAKKFRSKLP